MKAFRRSPDGMARPRDDIDALAELKRVRTQGVRRLTV